MKTLVPALAFILLSQGVPAYQAFAQADAAEESQPRPETKSKSAHNQPKRARKPAVVAPATPGAEPAEPAEAAVAEPPAVDFSAATVALKNAQLIQEGRLFYEMGKLEEAEARLKQAVKEDPSNKTAIHYLNQVLELKRADEDRNRGPLESFPAVDFTAATGALQMANDAVNSIFTTGGRNATLPLVIRSSGGDETSLANMMEDLTVMSRIIHKNIARGGSREQKESASGITLSAFASSRRPNTYYLEGYGAVFLVSVKFPLVPPTTKEERTKDEKAVDTDWEQTKMEIYGPRTSGRSWVFSGSPESPPVEYDADKVERLKNDLTEALKNATNIRSVKPDEYVTVAVIGTESSPMMTPKRVKKVRTNRSGAEQNNEAGASADAGGGGGVGFFRDDVLTAVAAAGDQVLHRQTTMTVRVRKSDADAFAKDKLSLEEFRKKVSIQAY